MDIENATKVHVNCVNLGWTNPLKQYRLGDD